MARHFSKLSIRVFIISVAIATTCLAIFALSQTTHFSNLAAARTIFLPSRPSLPRFPAGFSFKVSDKNQQSGDWNISGQQNPNEALVFWKELTHIQGNDHWTIKVGKGGQIYSISTPNTGEMIARQRTQRGEWVDEVFQHTIPSSLKNSATGYPVDGDIHQAGTYTHSDINRAQRILDHSYYSPTFSSILTEHIQDTNSFSYISWPQHAHLPQSYKENGMLMHQNIKDLGDGIIEISLLIDKWSGEQTDAIGVPWAGLRTESLPYQVVSLPDGSYKFQNQSFGQGKTTKLKDRTTNGWVAFTQSDTQQGYGIGIVYGNTVTPNDTSSYLRWGDYGSGTVATIKRQVKLLPGDSVFFRYYLVIGTLDKIQRYGNTLSPHVQVTKLNNQTVDQTVSICKDRNSLPRRGCINGDKPLFSTTRYHSKDSLPIFLIKNNLDSTYTLTSNPYTLSPDPTDQQTEYTSFLGWVTSNQHCQNISSIVTKHFPDINIDDSLSRSTSSCQ